MLFNKTVERKPSQQQPTTPKLPISDSTIPAPLAAPSIWKFITQRGSPNRSSDHRRGSRHSAGSTPTKLPAPGGQPQFAPIHTPRSADLTAAPRNAPGCTADSRRRPLSRHCTGQPGGAERRDVSRQSPAQQRGRGQHRAATRTQPREAGAAPGVLLPRETSGARTDCCGEENALRWTRAATEDRRAAAASGARTAAAQPQPGPTHTAPHGSPRALPRPPAAPHPTPRPSCRISSAWRRRRLREAPP